MSRESSEAEPNSHRRVGDEVEDSGRDNDLQPGKCKLYVLRSESWLDGGAHGGFFHCALDQSHALGRKQGVRHSWLRGFAAADRE